MKNWIAGAMLIGTLSLGGCESLGAPWCAPACHAAARASSSLVEFLYPSGKMPPASNAIPELPVPLRVGLAFLPSSGSESVSPLDAAHREELLERIRARFKDRPFVSEIISIPDYYLAGRQGFEGLQGVQRLYHVDLMALVSYDQVIHADDTAWSLSYLTIVGAYIVKGTHHEVSTLVDLAVVDPLTRSLVLRAGGTSAASDSATLVAAGRDARATSQAGFSAATDQMIEHFDQALRDFESEVRAGKAQIKVVPAHAGVTGGSGALDPWELMVLTGLVVSLAYRGRRAPERPASRSPSDPSPTVRVVKRPGFLAGAAKRLLRPLMQALFRMQVTGNMDVFRNDRTLIVANHESLLDGFLLGLFLPVEATFIVHTEVAKRALFRLLLRFIPHLLVDSTSPLAIKLTIRLVESGTPVVIFPEGRLTVTGSLMKVYDGAGFVAARTGATVVPVRIEGAGRSYFGRLAGIYPRQFLPRIRIAVQPRRTIPMPDLPSAKQRRRRAGEQMRGILTDMLVATRPERTLFQAFLDARATFGAGYRLVEDVRLREETYGSLLRMALVLARLLRSRTEAAEVVGVLTPNAAPTLGLILALSATGRVPALLNYTAGVEGLRSACTAAGIRNVFASRAFIDKARLGPVIAQLTDVRIHYLEDLRSEITPIDWLSVLAHSVFPRLMMAPQRPDDPAIVLFTSGSEGKPKGVVHSHTSILSNVAQIRAVADFSPVDKFMIALPLFHSFGLTCGVILPLVSGCKVFLYPSPLHYRVIPEIVYDRNCTVLFGTSTFLGNYAKFAHPYDFGRLRYVVAGAEKLAEDVRTLWIEKFGIRVLEGYGVTECAPVVAVNVPMACRIGSVGQLLPGMEHRLEPVPGIERGGILHVKGPNVMKGYLLYDRPGAIRPPESIGPGWHCTGDIVEIDDERFVYIRGRVKRFAKIAGEMISLEVAERIAAHAAPGCAHAASTRVDAAKGEAIVLFTTAVDLSRERLTAAARSLGAPELAVPRLVLVVAEIPLLGTGKTDYQRLKAMADTPRCKVAA